MTLQQLEYIVALDKHRQFVGAARACFVTQPTLTMQVKKLEEELGIQIFDRSRSPVVPTVTGERIISKARVILRESRQLQALVGEEKGSIGGKFTLGVIPTLAPYILPRFIGEFTSANPETHLQIREMQTADIVAGLNNDTIDVGLLVTPLEEKNIREMVLFCEPFLLFLPEGHMLATERRISPGQVHADEVLLLDEGHCFRSQMLRICNQKKTHTRKGFDYQSGSIEALKKMVERGMGYTLVPELSVIGELKSKTVKRFEEPQPVREVSLCVHNSFIKERLVDNLRQAILENLPKRFLKSQNFAKVAWK